MADEQTPWSTLTVDDWYGEGPREVDVATDTAVWYHTGKPPVAPPLGADSRPAKVLQTTSLVGDQSGAALRTDTGLVCASLDDGRNVGRSAGPSGHGNATPVE